MPIHGRIGPAIINRLAKSLVYEKKIWQGLYGPKGRYPGVSNYKQAARGIQHGLTIGSAVGSFIGEEQSENDSGSIPKYAGKASYQRSQKYSRQRKFRCRCRTNNRRNSRFRY